MVTKKSCTKLKMLEFDDTFNDERDTAEVNCSFQCNIRVSPSVYYLHFNFLKGKGEENSSVTACFPVFIIECAS